MLILLNLIFLNLKLCYFIVILLSILSHNKKSYHNLTNQINNTFVINNINNDYLDKYFYDKKSKYVLENTDEELNDVIFNNVSEKILKL